MLFKSKRGQLSIEMVILVLAVLLSGTLLAAHMTKDSGAAGEISLVKKQVFQGPTIVKTAVNGSSSTSGTGNPEENDSESEDGYTRIYIDAPINPTDSEQNNKFTAIGYSGEIYELKKDGSDKGLYINGNPYIIAKGESEEFSVKKIIVRVKQPSQSTVLINGSSVDKSNKKFTIECKEISPMTMKISKENGNQFYLELDATGVKVSIEDNVDDELLTENTYTNVIMYIDNLHITGVSDIKAKDLDGNTISSFKTNTWYRDTWYDASELEFTGDPSTVYTKIFKIKEYDYDEDTAFTIRASDLLSTIYEKVPYEKADGNIKIVSNIPQGIRFKIEKDLWATYITIPYECDGGYGFNTNNVNITFE
ncbi:class III signal peptide-containing protein [Methanococcus sp. CF]